jgi:diaminopimelate epimerase
VNLIKTHAYGNDFLLIEQSEWPTDMDRAAFAKSVCNRHRGLGADGLITFNRLSDQRARMSLLNADGSYSEVSGNGVRCLAAWLTRRADAGSGMSIDIETDAGVKNLTLLSRNGDDFTFRAAMGQPENLHLARLDVNGTSVEAVILRVGNPQCVVLGDVDPDRLHTLAAALAVHPHFAAGTNVELATVETPDRVRILIWERGVGPTEASGTGACAAAVAAIQYGGASRRVDVVSPGGTQRVEWLDDGLFLTGHAEVIASCQWHRGVPSGA